MAPMAPPRSATEDTLPILMVTQFHIPDNDTLSVSPFVHTRFLDNLQGHKFWKKNPHFLVAITKHLLFTSMA